MKRIRVLLADDHGVVRKGLRMQLQQQEQFEIVAEAADGRQAVQLAETENPDVVIMDVVMPGLGGIEATAQIVKRNPKIGVVKTGKILTWRGLSRPLLRESHSSAPPLPESLWATTCGNCNSEVSRTATTC